MLHACVERFDVMGVRGNILGWDGEVNKAHGFWFFPLKVSFTKNKKEVNVDELLSQTTYVMVIDG
jgi:hypothetical protein